MENEFENTSLNISENNNDYELTEIDLSETYDPLSVNAIEQVRRFLDDDKSFIDTSFLETVSNIIFSKSVGSDEKFRNIIKENIISFGTLCLKYQKLLKEHSINTDYDIVDEGLIKTGIILSNKFLTDPSINYTSQLIYETFKNIMSDPNKKLILETDEELNEKYKKYQTLKNNKIEDCEDLQKYLETKIETVEVLGQIQTLSQFIFKKANECSTLSEFTNAFINMVNNVSSSVVTSSDINKQTLNFSDILKGETLSEIIDTTSKIKCGIPIIDALMGGGFDKGRIYMFGGQTGGGKSTVLINIFYGILKQINGFYFSEADIFSRAAENDAVFDTIEWFINKHIEDHKNEKKKILLYYTLENTKEETAKRLMCRMGLLPSTFWVLNQRDKMLNKLLSTKGYDFNEDDLSPLMSYDLKKRLINFSRFMKLMCNKNQLCNIEIIWKAPYSITSYDIIVDCKRYERKGYDVEAIAVDYPDKMLSVQSINSSSKFNTDQNWLELGRIIDNLKAVAAQIKVPILTVTQLTRGDNKLNAASKLGSTAGSMQKEYNTDTQINMNFNTDTDDDSMTKYFSEFKNQQKKVNYQKSHIFNMMINPNSNQLDTAHMTYNKILEDTMRASDIIQMRIGIPTLQSFNSYITKNRDSIAKINFEMFIAYGMYVVTDYDVELYTSARYAVETYMLIANYMIENGFISAEAYNSCIENEKNFIDLYNVKAAQLNGFMPMRSLSKMSSSENMNNMSNFTEPVVPNFNIDPLNLSGGFPGFIK